MNSIAKTVAIAVLSIGLPLAATTANAAEARHPSQPVQSLTGSAKSLPGDLVAEKATAPGEKIVVARRGRWVGPAIVGGIVAGALIAGASRAHAYEHRPHRRSYYRHVDRCERLLWQCDHGERWACRKFYRQCD